MKKSRICSECGNDKTSDWWRRKKGFRTKWLCHKCYNKLYSNPKRLLFLGVRIFLKKNPRKGKCKECKKTVKSGYIQKTAIHHIKYHKSDPLKDTEELCFSCHSEKHNE